MGAIIDNPLPETASAGIINSAIQWRVLSFFMGIQETNDAKSDP